jgi:hypothetical protein
MCRGHDLKGTVSGVRYRLELPEGHGAEAVRDFIGDWMEQPALRRIVEAEGGRWPSGSLEQTVEALHDFSDRWDFRGGAERLEIDPAASHDHDENLLADAAELGMTTADRPIADQYDHALVLGGTALASVYRLRRLYELRAGGLDIGRTAVLTALREIGEPELQIVRERPEIAAVVDYSPRTEFDVMTRAVELFSESRAEVEHTPNENPNLASALARLGDVLVLAAPSADPGRRANSRDNYDAYVGQIGPADSILVVTSSIYLPYQFFVALQALGWEQPRTVEAVGFPPAWMQGILTGPQNVLQEIRSAFFGARSTLRALMAGESQ